MPRKTAKKVEAVSTPANEESMLDMSLEYYRSDVVIAANIPALLKPLPEMALKVQVCELFGISEYLPDSEIALHLARLGVSLRIDSRQQPQRYTAYV